MYLHIYIYIYIYELFALRVTRRGRSEAWGLLQGWSGIGWMVWGAQERPRSAQERPRRAQSSVFVSQEARKRGTGAFGPFSGATSQAHLT